MCSEINLRDFVFNASLLSSENRINSNDEISNRFFKSLLLKRGKSSTPITGSLANLQLMIDKRVSTNVKFDVYEFGDVNKKSNDISVRFALLAVGNELLKKHTLSLVELAYHFVKSRLNFLLSLNLEKTITSDMLITTQYYKIITKYILFTNLIKCDDSGFVSIDCPANNSTLRTIINSVENYTLTYFNLLIIPVPSETGHDKKGIFINDPLKSDIDILKEFHFWYLIKYEELRIVKEKKSLQYFAKKRSINDMQLLKETSELSPNQLKNLMTFLPSNMTVIIQFLLAVTTTDKDKLLQLYGITEDKKRNLILRVTKSIELGIEIRNRIQFTPDKIQALQQQLRIRCEKSKVFISRKTSLSDKYYKLDESNYKLAIGVMQQVARDLHGNSKERGDTPVDQIILNNEDYKEELKSYTGGIISRMTSIVNELFKTKGIPVSVSQQTIFRMLPQANISFQKSKNTFTLQRLDQHYCSATIKMLLMLAQIFSNEISIFSADAKSLIKVETAGNLKGKVIQLMSDMKRVRCHDQGVDILGKICLYVIELIQQDPSAWDFQQSEPKDGETYDKRGYINITDELIPGWNQQQHTKKTEGLGVAFAHHHNLHPETGARNASDIAQMIHLYLPYFVTNNDNNFKSTIFLIVDNSKGSSDAQTRFVWILMFLKFDLDCVVIMSYAGGFSKYNPVEKCNGCLSTRLNQYAIEFEGIDNYQYLSNEELNASMEKSIQRVIDICDGTSCSHTGGHIDVRKASHPPSYAGFKFDAPEITAFLDSKDKEHFKAKDMFDFGTSDEVSDFYNAAWRLLHSIEGDEKCVHQTKHTLCIKKNLNNPDLTLPLRGSTQFHDLIMSFGGNIPMPIGSKRPNKVNTEGEENSPRYMDLEEILQLSNNDRFESMLNYHLPSKLLNHYFQQQPNFMTDYIRNNKQISIEVMKELQLLVRASKRDIHIDFAHRIAKQVMQNREKALTQVQIDRGVYQKVQDYFLTSPLYDNKFTNTSIKKFLKSYHQTQIKGNKPILISKAYQVLIDNKLVDIDNDNNNNNNFVVLEAIALNGAVEAQNNFDALNFPIDDDDNIVIDL